MRTVEPTVQLRVEEGVLGGQCLQCDVCLEQEGNVDRVQGRQSFLAVHPAGS